MNPRAKSRSRRLSLSALRWTSACLAIPALHLGCVPKAASVEPAAPAPAPAQTETLPTITNGPWMNAALPPEQRAQLLVAEMTQEEKILLLFGYYGADAPWKNYKAPVEARAGSAGYVPGNSRLGIPPQWQTDAGIGVATQGSAINKRERTALPSGIAIASTWNLELAEAGGKMIGAEARASGFNVMLAGGVNLLRTAFCGRNFEYGGEDPLLAGQVVGAQIAGIQSNNIISTIKHFAVNDQETGRDKGHSTLEESAARLSDLLAFEFAMERGNPGALMCSYNKVNGTFGCENKELLTDILRKDWGFSGYVLSDWGATHSAAKAANSGLEQESGWPFDEQPYFQGPLTQALADGTVTEARLNEMVSRVLYAMFAHGLFEHPVSEQTIDMAAHGEVTRRAAEEGAVLLKNARSILPLSTETKSIAVIGGHADKGVLSGGGSSQVYSRGGNAVPGLEPKIWPGPVVYYPSSPLSEIKKIAPQSRVTFDSGSDIAAAAKLAKSSEIAIVFATQWTTESIDTDVILPNKQDALIAAVAAANPRTIVVLETGGLVLMPWHEKVAAVLEAWYPGTEGGKAIAHLLFGVVNPSGHLPMTVPLKVEQLTYAQAPQSIDPNYTEGATVGYKWFDQKGHEPLFAFGHGLSYTSFAYEGLSARAVGQGISATFKVKNTGKLPGKDVAQIYVARPGWEAPQRLGAFAKVDLKPGETAELSVTIDPRSLATWDAKKHEWTIAPGDVEVRLATSSRKVEQKLSMTLAGTTFPASGPKSAAPTKN